MRAPAQFSTLILGIGLTLVGGLCISPAICEAEKAGGAAFVRRWPHVSERMLDTTVELIFYSQMLPADADTISAASTALDELAAIELVRTPEEVRHVRDGLNALRTRLFRAPQVTEVKTERGVRFVGLPSLLANGTVRVQNWASIGAFEALRQPMPNSATWERHIIVDREYCAIFLPTLRSLEVHAGGKIGASFAASELLRPIPMGVRFDGRLAKHYELTSTGVLNRANGKVIQVCARGLPRKWGYADTAGTMFAPVDPDFSVVGAATYAVWGGADIIFPAAIIHVERAAPGQLHIRLVYMTAVSQRTEEERPPVALPPNTIAVDYSVHPPVRYASADPIAQVPQWSSLVWINGITVDPNARPTPSESPSRGPTPAPHTLAEVDGRSIPLWAIVVASLLVLWLIGVRLARRA